MNAEARVLQALDAAQAALRRLATTDPEERGEIARRALDDVANAPWSMVTRANEADHHGWLSQLREALMNIEHEPARDDVDRLGEEGLWAANELERDLRTTVGAR